MDGIVVELQREALDENVSIESLLRKAYLVARKLKLTEFEEWLNQEQNGYTGKTPEYRNVAGEMKAWNPYRGWIPMILPEKIANMFSRMPLSNSVSSLLDTYNACKDQVRFSVCGEMEDFLNSRTDLMSTKFAFFVSKSELYRIMSTVRNKILDWALLLEENGIIGNDMTFSDVERKIAMDTPIINNYSNNFYAEVSDIDMQQG